jgi:hypothetical protein
MQLADDPERAGGQLLFSPPIFLTAPIGFSEDRFPFNYHF